MSTQKPPFVAKYLPVFRKARELIEDSRPTLIVAIARKGPRLGELSAKFGCPIFPPNIPVVTQHALSFIGADSLRGRRVVVFDDVVIWGSTMGDIVKHPALDGAEVTPVVLVASRKRDPGAVPGLRYVSDIAEWEEMPFSTEIVEAFRLLAKPYNVDHPILELHGKGLSRLTEEDIANAAREHLGATVFRLSQPYERRNGIFKLTLNKPSLPGWHPVMPRIPHPIQLFKVRVFRNSESNVLRVEPILVFRTRPEDLLSGSYPAVEAFPSLGPIYKQATDQIPHDLTDQELRVRALYRLQMYLVELPLGLLFLYWLGEHFSVEIPDLPECLPSFDVELVLGQSVGQSVRHTDSLMAEVKALRAGRYQLALPSDTVTPDYSAWSAEFEQLMAKTRARLEISLSPTNALEDNVSWLLNALHDLDLATRVADSQQRGRLEFGYTYDEIGEALKRFGIQFEDHHLSAVIDYLVDTGVAVPVVKSREDGTVVRVFRFGEARSALNRLRYVVRIAISELIDRWSLKTGNQKQTLPFLFTDKALALLARSGQHSGQLTMDDIAVRLAYGRYGVDIQVEDVLAEGRLLQWAVADAILSREQAGLRLNDRFDERHPPRDNPLDTPQRALISQVMNWYVDASVETRDSANRYATALAVTTCNNVTNTIEAIKTEIRLWFGDHPRANAQGCLDRLYKLSQLVKNGGSQQAIKTAAKDLDESCKYGPADVMNQAELKLQVFRNLSHIQAQLGGLYSRGLRPGLDDVYRFYVDPLLNPTATEEEEKGLQVLERFDKVCQSWTSVLRTCGNLAQCRPSSLSRVRQALAQAVATNNRCVEELGRHSPALWMSARLPVDGQASASEVLDGLAPALLALLEELESLARTTVLTETKVEVVPLPTDVYIVMYDWIGSTDTNDTYLAAHQRHQLNAKVIPYAREHLGEKDCSPTGDDANAFVVGTLSNAVRLVDQLLDALKHIRVNARVSVTSTQGRQRLFFDKKYKTYGGLGFEIGARIRDYFKDEPFMRDGHSHVLVDGIVVEELARSEHSGKVGRCLTEAPVELRGERLPRVCIFEYVSG